MQKVLTYELEEMIENDSLLISAKEKMKACNVGEGKVREGMFI